MKSANPTKEDQLLLARLADLQRQAEDHYMIAAGDFLDAHQRKLAEEYLRGRRCSKGSDARGGNTTGGDDLYGSQEYTVMGDVRTVFYGGYEEAERCMPVFLPDYAEKADLEALLRVVRVRAPGSAAGGRKLTHRDYLGSLLALGIDRSVTGDILVRNAGRAVKAGSRSAAGYSMTAAAGTDPATATYHDPATATHSAPAASAHPTSAAPTHPGPGADIIVKAEIAEFIRLNYDKAGRTSLEVEILPVSALYIEPAQLEERRDTVASLRLDSIVASAFRLSRAKAAEAIRRGLVSVNSAEALKIDAEVEEGDRIVLRGQGKVVLTEVGGSTRKDRIRITIGAYR